MENYYSARDEGIVIRNGVLYRSKPYWDVAAVFSDRTMKTYMAGQISADALQKNGAMQVYSFGPMLLDKDGKALKKFSDPAVRPANPRTGIGYIEPNHFVLVVVDGRGYGKSKGLDIASFAKVFEGMGCQSAYNLDGCGSSVMIFMGKIVNHLCDYQPSDGQRASSNILYFGEEAKDSDNIEQFGQ